MISATGAGGHSSSPQPVTENPPALELSGGVAEVSPLKGVRRQRSADQGEGFPPSKVDNQAHCVMPDSVTKLDFSGHWPYIDF